MADVLIVDSHPVFSTALQKLIARMGHEAILSPHLNDGLSLAASRSFDVVFLNAQMPDGEGIEALSTFLAEPSFPEVIVLADRGDPDAAEQAIKHGAWEYIQRPSDASEVLLPFVRALQYRAKKSAKRSPGGLETQAFQDIIGKSPRIRGALQVLEMATRGDANVLITGETGTGKELFAWAIHNNSQRANRRFVVVDCASLPETLVESTLLGHEKGAFTGAYRAHEGLVRQADGGTLFLDEVSELPLSVQKSFLRVLHERRFRQVGGGKEIESDFRLITASNRDLDAMVQHRQFRKDLLFRLRGFTIELPPLRELAEDIKEIATFHMERLCEYYGMRRKRFSPEFFEVLARYRWPGNVRELVNSLDRALAAARHEPILFPKHLPTYVRVQLARASVSIESQSSRADSRNWALNDSMPRLADIRESAIAESEERYLKELMSRTRGDVSQACRIAGLSRSRLYALLKRYRISTSGFLP